MTHQTNKTLDELARNTAAASAMLALITGRDDDRYVGDLMPPLGLSDYQFALIKHAARSVSIDRRDDFLRAVASHLGAEPSDAAVQEKPTTAANARLVAAKASSTPVMKPTPNKHTATPPHTTRVYCVIVLITAPSVRWSATTALTWPVCMMLAIAS